MDSITISQILMMIFSRTGVPTEWLSDCGANITSQLKEEFKKLLGIASIRTYPYHPKTSGMLESFHAMVKAILWKIFVKFEKQWDRALPYVLFAFREALNEAIGFFPFEMIYSRHVRGHTKGDLESQRD